MRVPAATVGESRHLHGGILARIALLYASNMPTDCRTSASIRALETRNTPERIALHNHNNGARYASASTHARRFNCASARTYKRMLGACTTQYRTQYNRRYCACYSAGIAYLELTKCRNIARMQCGCCGREVVDVAGEWRCRCARIAAPRAGGGMTTPCAHQMRAVTPTPVKHRPCVNREGPF